MWSMDYFRASGSMPSCFLDVHNAKERQMHLEKLIDLIAEVAAKRAAQGAGREGETPKAMHPIFSLIRAKLRRHRDFFSRHFLEIASVR